VRDACTVTSDLESRGLLADYERVVEQLSRLDQKAQSMVSMEALLLALIAVFTSSIAALANNLPVKVAACLTCSTILYRASFTPRYSVTALRVFSFTS
jgi:hypothetical protein